MIAFILQSDWVALGGRIAKRLIDAGHEVCVFIKNGQQVAEGDLPDKGQLPHEVSIVSTLPAAIKEAQVIMTLLNTPQEVEDTYLGNGGIFEHTPTDSLFIDLSTSNPRLARELNALATVHDHGFVEAPLVYTADSYAAGTFDVYAASEKDDIKRALPILRTIASEVHEVGLPGSGSTLKLASQIGLAGTLLGVIEAVVFAMQDGIANEAILHMLKTSPAASATAQAFGKRIMDEDFYYGVPLQQFFFDLSAALDAADELTLALPGLETAHQLYDLMVLVGGAKKGIHALALIYRDEAYCTQHGLNWELAQQAMDVYEGSNEDVYDEEYYDEDCEDCDDPNCGYHSAYRGDGPPQMNRYFSSN